MMDVLLKVVVYANIICLFYVLIINIIYFFQLICAGFNLTSYVKKLRYSCYKRLENSETMLPISLIVPAYNEEVTIVDNINSLLQLNYPEYEVIIVNDGSRDNTLKELKDEFELVEVNPYYKTSIKTKKIKAVYRSTKFKELVVVDKENGGKADALNAGINVSRYPIFSAIDADSILERDSLIRLISPFYYDSKIDALGGIIRIASGCEIENGVVKTVGLSKNPLVKLQTVEYLRAFLTGRMGFDKLNSLLIISGAFGAFKKSTIIEIGGYDPTCIGEDMELIVRLHEYMKKNKKDYKIKFIPDPVCWTQPPENLKDLRKQRKRWHIGLINTLFKHKKMLFNPKYGSIGMFALPYYWIFEMIGPVFETFGYLLVIISFLIKAIDLEFMITFFLLSFALGTILSIGSILLEEYTFKRYTSVKEVINLVLFSFIDNLGFRHLNNIYKIEGLITYKKNKNNWGHIKRKKISTN